MVSLAFFASDWRTVVNYDSNHHQWIRGSIVIHDEDAKEPMMLMKITGFTKDGLAKCQYVDRRKKRKLFINHLKYLHAPESFGLNPRWGEHAQEHIERYQDEFVRVRRWNHYREIGQLVKTTSGDGGFETITTSKAWQATSGDALVLLERGGVWLLKFVEAVKVEQVDTF